MTKMVAASSNQQVASAHARVFESGRTERENCTRARWPGLAQTTTGKVTTRSAGAAEAHRPEHDGTS